MDRPSPPRTRPVVAVASLPRGVPRKPRRIRSRMRRDLRCIAVVANRTVRVVGRRLKDESSRRITAGGKR